MCWRVHPRQTCNLPRNSLDRCALSRPARPGARHHDDHPSMLAFLFAPLNGVWFWAVLLGCGRGGGFALALSLIVMRSPDAMVTARLSAMAQGWSNSLRPRERWLRRPSFLPHLTVAGDRFFIRWSGCSTFARTLAFNCSACSSSSAHLRVRSSLVRSLARLHRHVPARLLRFLGLVHPAVARVAEGMFWLLA